MITEFISACSDSGEEFFGVVEARPYGSASSLVKGYVSIADADHFPSAYYDSRKSFVYEFEAILAAYAYLRDNFHDARTYRDWNSWWDAHRK